MIELRDHTLHISFPEVHEAAAVTIGFQRTLRIPDDDRTYNLPPGLGKFPLLHVDDFADNLPASWKRRGGVMLPLYQSEALWLAFGQAIAGGFPMPWTLPGPNSYPCAIKIGAGKINAVNGEAWTPGLDLQEQGYLVYPSQCWLDGFAIERGTIRQFVAMPLGSGYSAEEQITGEARWGGLQVEVFPLRASAYERLAAERWEQREDPAHGYCERCSVDPSAVPEMTLSPGGRMRQEIYRDPYQASDWDLDHGARCFVHLANSQVWRQITGSEPPPTPVTAAEYEKAGLPWFDYYDDAPALEGSEKLADLTSVASLGKTKGEVPLADNTTVETPNIVQVGPKRRSDLVRVGKW